jgi:hypothetical protein
MADLVLITRAGCCLCEGLEEKLRQLPWSLELRDVDADPALKARYDLEVPVLLVGERELPRASPRFSVAQLGQWLRAQGLV